MNAVRSLIFNILFISMLIVFMLVCLPLLLAPRRYGLRVAKVWSGMSVLLLKRCLGVRFEVRGKEHIPKGACLIAAKHQSMFETIALFHILEDPVFMLKQELMRIPLYGTWAKKFEMVPVDRKSTGKTLAKTLEGVKTALQNNHQVIIFVEGTRTKPNAAPHYKRGLAHIAHNLKKQKSNEDETIRSVPIIPLALNSGTVWPKKGWRKHKGDIFFEFCPAISVGETTEETTRHLEHIIENACQKLPQNTSLAS